MFKPNLIIIEGVDRAGKTFTIRELQKLLKGYPRVKAIDRYNTSGLYHIRKTIALYGARPNDFYEDLVATEVLLQTGAKAMFDRSLVSATVYRWPATLHSSIMDHWYSQLADIKTLYIWMDVTCEFVNRNGATFSKKQFDKLDKRFKEHFRLMPAGLSYEPDDENVSRNLIKKEIRPLVHQDLIKFRVYNDPHTHPEAVAGLIYNCMEHI